MKMWQERGDLQHHPSPFRLYRVYRSSVLLECGLLSMSLNLDSASSPAFRKLISFDVPPLSCRTVGITVAPIPFKVSL